MQTITGENNENGVLVELNGPTLTDRHDKTGKANLNAWLQQHSGRRKKPDNDDPIFVDSDLGDYLMWRVENTNMVLVADNDYGDEPSPDKAVA